ncbi:MAG: hypothetical protein KC646_05455 [Candidatus Cloacimonetes bacterium]|nr:hypothetical protein [Candidatus Cloacimonadota bacterium]
MTSKVNIVSIEVLNKQNTKQLLARLKRLLQCCERFEDTDLVGYVDEPDYGQLDYIEYKSTKQWKQAYKDLKTILATREHVKK